MKALRSPNDRRRAVALEPIFMAETGEEFIPILVDNLERAKSDYERRRILQILDSIIGRRPAASNLPQVRGRIVAQAERALDSSSLSLAEEATQVLQRLKEESIIDSRWRALGEAAKKAQAASIQELAKAIANREENLTARRAALTEAGKRLDSGLIPVLSKVMWDRKEDYQLRWEVRGILGVYDSSATYIDATRNICQTSTSCGKTFNWSRLVWVNTDLREAALHGRWNIVEFLLSQGIDPNSRFIGPNWTLAHIVANGSSPLPLRVLLPYKIDLDAKDAAGRTPLHLALANKHEVMAIALLAAGASPSIPGPDGTPVEMAEKGEMKLVLDLLREPRGTIK